MTSKERVFEVIMKFMKETMYCYENTTYTSDRPAYASDIVLCAKWLISIYNNDEVLKIVEDILDTSTSKHILDYYKQGKLGDEQAKSFASMRKNIEEIQQSV